MAEVSCFLGAGFSVIAGVPLARDLFSPEKSNWMSYSQARRIKVVLSDYARWRSSNPDKFPEQFLTHIYNHRNIFQTTPWPWAVEAVCAAIASPHSNPPTPYQNPRYYNRITKPSGVQAHRDFWTSISEKFNKMHIITTNYDLLIERSIRHRTMIRLRLPGFYYGGFEHPQVAISGRLPYAKHDWSKRLEISGQIPLYKLHGSLNWAEENNGIQLYQDSRLVWKHETSANH